MVYKSLLVGIAACLLSTATYAQKNYEKGDPSKSAEYGYLSSYAPLKDYIDYAKYPYFKLGLALTARDYINGSVNTYNLANDNFTEIVAGNAMKMASCVDNNGNLNFSTVTQFVNKAAAAGQNVYGHTLAWHAQQPAGWLRSLMADRPAPVDKEANLKVYRSVNLKDFTKLQNVGWTSSTSDYGFTLTFSASDGLLIHTTKKNTNPWDVQFLAVTGLTLEEGADYQVSMKVRGTSAGKLHTKLGNWNDGISLDLPFTTEWQTVTMNYNKSKGGDFYMLQCGDYVGDIYVQSIDIAKATMVREVTEDRRCLVVSAGARTAEAWDNQFWIIPGSFAEGASYEFTALVRADKPAHASTQIHTTPGSYVHYEALGDVPFTTDWKTVRYTGKFSRAGSSIAFNLSELADANNYYFDDMSFKVNGVERLKNGNCEGTDFSAYSQKDKNGGPRTSPVVTKISYIYSPSPIPLTAKEKHDTLVYAMDKWISGMMKACGGKVKAWDVVNESISGGGDNGQGFYTLQHGNGEGNDFFWQDYMGDLEYVRQAVRLARKYGPSDIKLFINDYNLESDWDNNKKLRSLINWIGQWEADGVTKIDGIGSQMHISCYMNEGTQQSKKNHIKEMLQLMAATGKLVRISELDMGMVDAAGKDVPTSEVTEEMHHRMADLYEWIIKTYLEVVPAKQQWGICQWCATDAPSNSGWRADTPVGLWTLGGNYRKHAFAGYAEGLGGIVHSDTPPAPAVAPTIAFQNGKLKFTSTTPGATFKYDVKTSFAGTDLTSTGESSFNPTFTITAWAEAEGYLPSVPTTLVVRMGDMNMDGKLTIEDVVKLVDTLQHSK